MYVVQLVDVIRGTVGIILSIIFVLFLSSNIGSIINHTLFDSVLFLSNVRYQSNIILSAHMIQQIVCRRPADFDRFLGNYIVDVVLNLEASCVNVSAQLGL